MNRFIICGIGTEVGKTVVSAILVEALGADYWKPVQCGSLEKSDRFLVESLTASSMSAYHPEQFQFARAAAPLQAAQSAGVPLSIELFQLPQQGEKPIVVELCGGLMVPINGKQLLCEAFFGLGFEWVLVSKNYLGSINHTLLSVHFLKNHREKIRGIIFNGEDAYEGESFILDYTQLPCLGRLQTEPHLSKEWVSRYAKQWRDEWIGG